MSVRSLVRLAPLGLMVLAGCADVTQIRAVLEMDGEAMSVAGMSPYEQGKQELAKGRLGLAVSAFAQALSREPGSTAILNALAATYDRMGRFDLADRYYARALETTPDDPQTLNNLGYSRYLRGDLAQAVTLLERAQRREAHPVTAANLAAARTALAANPAREAVVAAKAEAPPPAPRMILERTAPGVHTLALATPELLVAARKAGVPPELAAVHGRAPRTAAARPFPADDRIDLAALAAVAAPPVQPPPTPAVSCRLEISNGAGRPRMATRMRTWLRSTGVDVGCLTNAPDYGRERSIIFHRQGFEAEARALAARLPVAVTVEAAPAQTNDVRLVLGRDLLPFDDDLLQKVSANEA